MKLSLVKILKENQTEHLVPSLKLFQDVLTVHNDIIDELVKEFKFDIPKDKIIELYEQNKLKAFDNILMKINNDADHLSTKAMQMQNISTKTIGAGHNKDAELVKKDILNDKINLNVDIINILKLSPEKWYPSLDDLVKKMAWEAESQRKLADALSGKLVDITYMVFELKNDNFETLFMGGKMKKIISILPDRINAFQNAGLEITDYLDEIWIVNEVLGLAKFYFPNLDLSKEEQILYEILSDWT